MQVRRDGFLFLALVHYIRSGEELQEADLFYLAQRSIELNELTLQRACFECLKSSTRGQATQLFFEQLERRVAEKEVSRGPTTDRHMVNPIYDQIATRRPVDRLAAMMVAKWADDIAKKTR